MTPHRYVHPRVIELRPNLRTARNGETVIGRLKELVEELLDAHSDTVAFDEQHAGAGWAAHLDYLKDLQRIGQQSLAQLASADS